MAVDPRASARVIPLPGAAASPVVQTRSRRGSLPRGVVKLIDLRVARWQEKCRQQRIDQTNRRIQLEAARDRILVELPEIIGELAQLEKQGG